MGPSDFGEKPNLDKTVAIRIISNIVKRYLTNKTDLVDNTAAAIDEILLYWPYIPDDLRKKAEKVIHYLWKKGSVLLSTEVEKAEKYVNIQILNERLSNLRDILPTKDKSIISQSVYITNLINRRHHLYAEENKNCLIERYHFRGNSILNMITTGDIETILDELQEIQNNKGKIERFNWWVEHYYEVSVLISPDELSTSEEIEGKIINASKEVTRPYLLIHLAGSEEDCNKLLEIVTQMKTKKELEFKHPLTHIIKESGWYWTINIRLDFFDL